MQKKTRRRNNHRRAALSAVVSVAIIAAILVILFVYLNSKSVKVNQNLPDMSGYAFLNNNYTMNSTGCSRYNFGEICTEILYRYSNITSLPITIALASYNFTNSGDAYSYINSGVNGTPSTFTGSNRTFTYATLPFINGQTVFTALVMKGNTVYSVSALFDPSQQTYMAKAVTSNLVYKLAYG